MKFTLQQLRYVSKIIEKGSLSEAAKDLSITQAGLSLAITQLEKDLGVTLFERVARGVAPTEACTRLSVLSNKVLTGAREIEEEFSNRSFERPWLNIGAMTHSMVERSLVEYVNDRNGEVSWFGLEIYPGSMVYKEVADGVKNLGISYSTRMFEPHRESMFEEVGVRKIELCEVPLHVFVSVDHPLADKDVIYDEDLERFPYFTYDQYMFHQNHEKPVHRRNPIEKNGNQVIVQPDCHLDNLMKEIAGVNGYTIWGNIGIKAVDANRVRSIPLASNIFMSFFALAKRGRELKSFEQDYLDYYTTWLQSV